MLSFLLSFPQGNAENELLENITKETCTCIEADKEKINTLQGKEKSFQLGICILKAYEKFKDSYNTVYGKIDFANENAMYALGEKVGVKMAEFCPDLLLMIAESTDEYEPTVYTLKGRINVVPAGLFNTVEVTEETGRSHKLIWLYYVEGSPILENTNTTSNVFYNIDYEELELFDASIKEYRKFKVISRIYE